MSIHTPSSLRLEDLDAVILDMDGTLLDLRFDDLVWNQRLPQRYARQHRISLTQAETKIKSLMSPIRGTLPWYCFDNWQQLTGIDLTEIEDEVFEYVRPRPGAVEFLQRLSEIPAMVVLATNADQRSMARKIAHTAIAPFFDHIFSSHEFGYAKETQNFWCALNKRISFDPSRTLFIDDNHSVLSAAKLFGIQYLFGIAEPAVGGDLKSSAEFHCLSDFESLQFA